MTGYLTVVSFAFLMGNFFPVTLNVLFSWGVFVLAGVRKLIRLVMISLPGPAGQNLSLLAGMVSVLTGSVLYLVFIQSLNTWIAKRKSRRYPLVTYVIHAAGVPAAFLMMPEGAPKFFIPEAFILRLILFLAGAIPAAWYIYRDWRLALREIDAVGQNGK